MFRYRDVVKDWVGMRIDGKALVRGLVYVLQGALIGLGAVLPGISGGVLSVLFGVYKPLMEFLANPVSCFKSHVPRLLPYILGYVIGFMGIANLLAFFAGEVSGSVGLSFCGIDCGDAALALEGSGTLWEVGQVVCLYGFGYGLCFCAANGSAHGIRNDCAWICVVCVLRFLSGA